MSDDVSIKCKNNEYILTLSKPLPERNCWTITCKIPDSDNTIPKGKYDEIKWICEVVVVQKDDEYILKDIKPPCINLFPNLQKIRNTSFKTPKKLLEKFGNTVYP